MEWAADGRSRVEWRSQEIEVGFAQAQAGVGGMLGRRGGWVEVGQWGGWRMLILLNTYTYFVTYVYLSG